jgi:hypothetical protein
MWKDAMNGPIAQAEVADFSPRSNSSVTSEFRLLGDRANERSAVAGYQWGEEWSRGEEPSEYGATPWQLTPQFALFSEVDSRLIMPTEYEPRRRYFMSRLARVVKRLLIPATLGLLALGLIMIVTSPLLGRAAPNSVQGAMRLGGYWEPAGAGPSVAQQTGAVPVINAKSDTAAPPQLAVGTSPYDVVGPPSISVEQIERVLRKYGSPAAGQGKLLHDLGVRYGIDPAYALAFFVHESGCGTKGVARFTKSLGNIRWTEGYDNYSGYRKYSTWEAGIEDWYKLITELYIGAWNLRTVDTIIPVYAPWGDNNNPPAYISSVKGMVDSWRGK